MSKSKDSNRATQGASRRRGQSLPKKTLDIERRFIDDPIPSAAGWHKKEAKIADQPARHANVHLFDKYVTYLVVIMEIANGLDAEFRPIEASAKTGAKREKD